jgi:hypothetical protein
VRFIRKGFFKKKKKVKLFKKLPGLKFIKLFTKRNCNDNFLDLNLILMVLVVGLVKVSSKKKKIIIFIKIFIWEFINTEIIRQQK